MKRISLAAALIFVGTVAYVGCKKDLTSDTETTSATDNNLCEGEFMRIPATINGFAIDEPGVHSMSNGNSVASSCPMITVVNPNQFPVDMIIDYGTGCTDSIDGKVRKGRINVNYSMPWDSVGCVMTVTLDSFYVGAIRFEGTSTLTRTGATSFEHRVTNGRCSKTGTNAWEVLWGCDKTISWTQGSTSSQLTQVIEINGTSAGTDRNGKTFSTNITSPLVRDLSCSWITKGTVVLSPEGKADRTVDFGNGNCDNVGTITIEGNTFEFSMQ